MAWRGRGVFCFFAAVSFLGFLFVYRRHRRIRYVEAAEDQNLSLFSETAFYYSFYIDVLQADSLWEGVKSVLYDVRSEAPSVVNGLKRYNIYQEVVMGALYRQFPFNWLFRTPFNFYAFTVFLLIGTGIGFLSLTSKLLGNSYACAIATFGFFFANYHKRFVLRISSIPLRENWNTPFLWAQILLLCYILRIKFTPPPNTRTLKVQPKTDPQIVDNQVETNDAKIYNKKIETNLKKIYKNPKKIEQHDKKIEKNHKKIEKNIEKIQQTPLKASTPTQYLLYGLFTVLTIVRLLTWQFSGFALTLEASALFATVLLGFPILEETKKFFLCYTVAYGTACAMHFFPAYLLLGFFPQILCSVLVVLYLIPPTSWLQNLDVVTEESVSPSTAETSVEDLRSVTGSNLKNQDNYSVEIVEKYTIRHFSVILKNLVPGVVSLLVCFGIRSVITSKFLQEDGHVFQMLLTKFGMAKHNFDSKIYLMGGTEFDMLADFHVDIMRPSGIMYFSSFFATTLLCLSFHRHRLVRGSEKNGAKHRFFFEFCHPEYAFFTILSLFFVILMILISRLRILAVPLMCVLGGLIASPTLWGQLCSLVRLDRIFLKNDFRTSRFRSFIALLPLLFAPLPFFLHIPLDEMGQDAWPENSLGESKSGVLRYMETHLPADASILTDMPMSSSIRVHSRTLKTVLNPQYEDVTVREKVQFLYKASACPDLEQYAEDFQTLYNAPYLLLSVYRCAAPKDSRTVTVWDVADHLDDTFARCPKNVNPYQRFCWRILFDQSGLFELKYRNPDYNLYKINPPKDAAPKTAAPQIAAPQIAAPTYADYLAFDARKLMAKAENYSQWLKVCKEGDGRCGATMMRTARQLHDLYGLRTEAQILRQFVLKEFPRNLEVAYVYAEYLDFDAKQGQKALQFYHKAMEGNLQLLFAPSNLTSQQVDVFINDPSQFHKLTVEEYLQTKSPKNSETNSEKNEENSEKKIPNSDENPQFIQINLQNLPNIPQEIQPNKNNLKFVNFTQITEYLLYFDEVFKTQKNTHLIPVARLFRYLLLNQTDFQLNPRVSDLCRVSTLLLDKANGGGTAADERREAYQIAKLLWSKAKFLNKQQTCVKTNFQHFEHSPLTKWTIFKDFLFAL